MHWNFFKLLFFIKSYHTEVKKNPNVKGGKILSQHEQMKRRKCSSKECESKEKRYRDIEGCYVCVCVCEREIESSVEREGGERGGGRIKENNDAIEKGMREEWRRLEDAGIHLI